MRIHVIYFCPRCGCRSFRRSAARFRKDRLLRMLGVHPQRCYNCKVRFYLFQPGILKTTRADSVPTQLPAGEQVIDVQ
jgi:hypothetical protein